MNEPTAVSNRATVAVLTGGSLASAACFFIGVLLGIDGRPSGGDVLDPAAIADGAVALEPWAWSTLGVLLLIGTPAAALVATAVEFGRRDVRTTGLALLVLGILVLSLVIALVR